jgi:hypothetical protein
MNGWIIIVRAKLYRDCYTISGSEISMTNHDNDMSRTPHRRISRGYNQPKTAHGLPYQAMAPPSSQSTERATKRTLTCMLTLRMSSGVMARWLVAAASIPPPAHRLSERASDEANPHLHVDLEDVERGDDEVVGGGGQHPTAGAQRVVLR